MEKKDNSLSRPSVRVRTLGCKVNFCDGRALVQALTAAGLSSAAPGHQADAEVVNTCAVTARSVQKARMLIRHTIAQNPSATVIVTGCAVRLSENPFADIPGVDAVCPWPADVVRYLASAAQDHADDRSAPLEFERTRAFLKIQDGCQAGCSYCIVPLVRGVCRSVEPGEVVSLTANAASRGYREIVLCGIHLGQYGRDLGGVSLAGLMREIARLPGDFRVRLSSMEPLEATEELLETMAEGERFCPHLHLPLQSGSDRVLAAMGRPYRLAQYLETLGRVRQLLNNPAITTDIMVGFPGETEDDHALTLKAIKSAGFARGHVFVFSPRAGTRAAAMEGKVAAPVARRRSLEARQACAAAADGYRASLVATTAQVIVERASDGMAEGFCRRYQRVRFPAADAPIGGSFDVVIRANNSEGFLDGETRPRAEGCPREGENSER